MKTVDSPKTINGINVVNRGKDIFEELMRGHKVYHWEAGDSMTPILRNMEYCLLEPVSSLDDVKVGDAVFCRLNNVFMVHMVTMISDSAKAGKWFQISSTGGRIYGWTQEVFAIAKGTDIFESHHNFF